MASLRVQTLGGRVRVTVTVSTRRPGGRSHRHYALLAFPPKSLLFREEQAGPDWRARN